MKKSLAILSAFLFVLTVAVSGANVIFAASPDGQGPWADSVVSFSQGKRKDGSAVLPTRSDPAAALGVAENNTTEGNFVSLGFGGSVTLGFENGISNGVFVFEATNDNYANENAKVEFSEDGSDWKLGGFINQDDEVEMTPFIKCAKFVRITDTTVSAGFEDTADGYDVDGVEAKGDVCQPAGTPAPSTNPSPTPGNDNGGNDNGGNNNNDDDNSAPQCNDSKPGTPTITGISRINATTVRLTWSAVSDASYYSISYGTSPGNYQYGVANTGNTTSFEIGGLAPNQTYYFVVNAVHNCKPGDRSGESRTGGSVLGASTGGQVLGASTDELAGTGAMDYAVTAAAVLGLVSSIAGFVSLVKKSN